jgi:Flp pilus assembly protein TadG
MMIRSTRNSRREHGQILVVFAGSMVLFLAVVALVVDLGFVFMLHRQEQNAADPGAVAAARYIPSGDVTAMWSAACFMASQNGFTPRRADNNASCVAGTPADDSTLTVNWPPSPAAVEYAGNRGYVEVTITRPHHSFFAGIVGLPTITVATAAVAANDTGAAGSSSLVALNPTACPAAVLHGGGGGGGGSGGGVYIFPATGVPPGAGGYVQVNSICGAAYGANDNCLDGPQGGLKIAGGTDLTSNTIYIQGACVLGGSATIHPPTTFDEQAAYVGDPLALLRPPSPTDLVRRDCPGGAVGDGGFPTSPKTCNINGTQTAEPGTYYGGWSIGNGTTLTLNAGIYIIAGGGIQQSGGLVAASGRVLIYSTDSPVCGTGSSSTRCQQKVDFAGSGSLDLRGLDKNSPCLPYGSPGCPYGGLLIWQDGHASGAGTASSNVELGGGTSLRLEGTIYAPAGEVIVTGNSLGTGCATTGPADCAAIQIVSDTWDVGGAGVLNMPYDPSKFYNPKLKGLVR